MLTVKLHGTKHLGLSYMNRVRGAIASVSDARIRVETISSECDLLIQGDDDYLPYIEIIATKNKAQTALRIVSELHKASIGLGIYIIEATHHFVA